MTRHVPRLSSGIPFKLEKQDNADINLFVPYYLDKEIERRDEINVCLLKNSENVNISKIFLISEIETVTDIDLGNKIEIILLKRWTTFNDIISFINSREEFKNSFNIISNTDVWLDDSIQKIKNLNIDNSCIALSLWTKGILTNEESSQGVWIFKGHIKEFKYILPIGKPGSDNRLLFELHNNKYTIYSFCYDIIATHEHDSCFRKYSENDRIPEPYMFLWSSKKGSI